MGNRDSYAPGTFCWADLGTTDIESARAFYTRVFGWQAVDRPTENGETYTRFRVEDRDVAALYEMGEEERARLTPHWSSYVNVENVEKVAVDARARDAEILAEPFDVFEDGRLTVVRDPTGATVHAWQAKGEIGARRVNDPGCMVWNELATGDVDRAREFYTGLFGWTTEREQHSGYELIRIGGALNGGLRTLQDDESPYWLVYFTVAGSCDEAAATVREAGGHVLAGPLDTGVGRIALVADPQGARFALFEGDIDP
jgi:predicted enzyme related to lactoylglutathione lyase